MRKTKKNAASVAIENGKSVFNAGMNEAPTKGTTANAEHTANEDTTGNPTWEAVCYESMRGTQLADIVTSVKLSDVRKNAGDLATWLRDIDTANELTNEENRRTLLRAAVRAFLAYPFASVEERTTARKKAFSRWLNTNAFRTTYQNESNESTTGTYESGAYFSRKTGRYTAAAIRTAFNSCEYMKRTAAMIQAKREAERKANAAREYLAKQDAAEILANLTPSQLSALLAKIKG